MLGQVLAGTRVLDCSQGIAAPHAAGLLAEMGAAVVKVEPPAGDWLRGMGVRTGDASVLYRTFNRGKRGIVLDLKSAAAREAVLRLAAHSDVFVESNRPGVMARLGLDYGAVRAVNPRIVYLSVSGFGQTGPSADRPATDTVMQAFTGLAYGAGDMQTPVRVRVALVDVVTGLYASHAVLGALLGRARTGQGAHVDVSLMHGMAALQSYKIAEHASTGGRVQGEAFAGIGLYRTSDGYLALSAMREEQVVSLLRIVGRADLLEDARFATPEARFANQGPLREQIGAALAARPARAWAREMQAIDLLCQEVHTYDAFRRDPQALAYDLFQTVDGDLPAVRMPGLASDETRREPAPRLGEHTREVLREAGFMPAEIDALAGA